MPDQRQRVGAVLRETDRYVSPSDIRTAKPVLRLQRRLDERTVVARQPLDFVQLHRVHVPLRRHRVHALGEGEQAAGPEQIDQLAKRSRPLSREDMHPDHVQ